MNNIQRKPKLQTVAVYEFVTHRKKVASVPSGILNNPKAVVNFVKNLLFDEKDSWREKCIAVYLNKAGSFLGYEVMSVGGRGQTAFEVLPVCRTAIQVMADAVIVVHNHPSGDPTPSPSDIRQTENLRRALGAVQLEFRDAIILGDKSYFSFADETQKNYE